MAKHTMSLKEKWNLECNAFSVCEHLSARKVMSKLTFFQDSLYNRDVNTLQMGSSFKKTQENLET